MNSPQKYTHRSDALLPDGRLPSAPSERKSLIDMVLHAGADHRAVGQPPDLDVNPIWPELLDARQRRMLDANAWVENSS